MAKAPRAAGLQTPRERMWAAALQFSEFSVAEWRSATSLPIPGHATAASYLRVLLKNGLVVVASPGKLARDPNAREPRRYRVAEVRTVAPRVAADGRAITMGDVASAAWRAMQVLRVFDAAELQAAASLPGTGDAPGFSMSASTCRYYIARLRNAGYLQAMPAKRGRYRLVRNTGALAPALMCRSGVLDRNTGEFFAL